MNLPDNHKTNVLGLLRLKFIGFRNGDDNNVQKLPEECLRLENF